MDAEEALVVTVKTEAELIALSDRLKPNTICFEGISDFIISYICGFDRKLCFYLI